MSEYEFADFYIAHKDRCLRAAVAGGIGAERAEDAVAEAFARAWARWGSVRSHPSPAAWVVRTAINADISWWRKRRREVPGDGAPEAWWQNEADPTDLIAAIRRLPPRQREVVVHRYLLDLDSATTAAHLGIATGTVKAHLHHALAALRDHLSDRDASTERTRA